MSMRKFQRAVFCYYITGFNRGLRDWILCISGSLRFDGFMSAFSDRVMVAKWLTDLFDYDMDFDSIVDALVGDAFAEKFKRDIARVQRVAGKPITKMWDTDPIFAKYPHLRGLARNKEFEVMWAKMKQRVK